MRISRHVMVLGLLFTSGTSAQAGNLPVPDAKAQAKAEAGIRNIYKDDYTRKSPADRQALVAKLLAEGQRTSDDPGAKYVLLRQSAEVATSVGDFAGLSAAAKELADTFAVRSSAVEAELLIKFPPPATTPDNSEIAAREYADVLKHLVSEEGFEPIPRLAAAGLAAARKAHDVELANRIDLAERNSRDLQTELGRFKTAQAILAKNPDDPAADLLVGRYFCFLKEDWDNGLAYLSKSSDRAVKAAAAADAANPTDAKAQLAVADAWLALIPVERSKSNQGSLKRRAGKWYTSAIEGLAGLERIRVEKRLAELKSDMAENSAPGAADNIAAASLSVADRNALTKRHADLIDIASKESDKVKRFEKLTEAGKITLQLDPKAGLAELDDIVAQAIGLQSADRAGAALIEEGKFFGAHNNWKEAEVRLSRVWNDFRGDYGDKGCKAAEVMVKHFQDMQQFDNAVQYQLIIMDCGGYYHDPAGAAGLWLGDYYIKKGNRAKAIEVLKEVYQKHAGSYDSHKKKAKEKLAALGETVSDAPK